jgi:hypothetical protein
MARGALLLSVAMMLGVVTPELVSARAPQRRLPQTQPSHPAETAPAEEAERASNGEPAADPAAVEETEAGHAGATAAEAEGEPVRYDESTQEAPSTADRVLQNRQVRTMVNLFGRGLTVNDDDTEPPNTPVRVRVRPKGAGASLSLSVLF